MGNTAPKILKEIETLPDYNKNSLKILTVKNMSEAVFNANRLSKSGDIVILSPACASFDLYNNFEERGNHFKLLVREIMKNKI